MLRVRVLEQAFIEGCSGGDDVSTWLDGTYGCLDISRAG